MRFSVYDSFPPLDLLGLLPLRPLRCFCLCCPAAASAGIIRFQRRYRPDRRHGRCDQVSRSTFQHFQTRHSRFCHPHQVADRASHAGVYKHASSAWNVFHPQTHSTTTTFTTLTQPNHIINMSGELPFPTVHDLGTGPSIFPSTPLLLQPSPRPARHLPAATVIAQANLRHWTTVARRQGRSRPQARLAEDLPRAGRYVATPSSSWLSLTLRRRHQGQGRLRRLHRTAGIPEVVHPAGR